MRRAPDGSFFLVTDVGREDLVKEMNRNYERVPGELRWFPKVKPNEIKCLTNRYIGQTCHIVGKGPSLDRLKILPLSGPVIAINESLYKVEAIRSEDVFGIIQDHGIMVNPKFATLLLNYEVRGWFDTHNQKIHFKPSELGYDVHYTPISAIMAIKIAELMGCTEIKMYAFDGCLNASLNYAKCIGHEVSGDATRFRKHKASIDSCTKLPVHWIPIVSKPEILIEGMQGLGDNIFQRAAIKKEILQSTVYLKTPWPQFYSDLGVTCISSTSGLRTQAKNEHRSNYGNCPPWLTYKKIGYKRGEPIFQGFDADPQDCSFTVHANWITESYQYVPKNENFIVVKPPTLRSEYLNPARNPQEGYIGQLATKTDCKILSIADLQTDEEWLADPEYDIDFKYHHGEIKPEIIAALMLRAKYTITPVGFPLAFGLALNVPTFCVFGGHSPPDRIFDPRFKSPKVRYVAPNPFCGCLKSGHNCNKQIPNLVSEFDLFLKEVVNG